MTFMAKDVFERVGLLLQDNTYVRWSLPELRLWLNDGLREIAIIKPNAVSQTIILALVAGTKQNLLVAAQETTTNFPLSLITINRNVAPITFAPGKAVTPVSRIDLDAQLLNWHDSNIAPYDSDVRHVVDDMTDEAVFYVYPGNDGSGFVEAVVAIIPDEVAESGTPDDISTYTQVVDLKDIYMNALIHYVLYRAFSKEMELAGSAQRAASAYSMFQAQLGSKLQADTAANVNTAS